MSTDRMYATFYLAGAHFGVDALEVQEALREQTMTRVHLVSPEVSGLINLRGQVVTAIDMRRRLGIAAREGDELPMNLVVRTDDGPVSFLVDAIGDVLEVSGLELEAAPETVPPGHRELIRGVFKLDGELLLALDVARAAAPMHP